VHRFFSPTITPRRRDLRDIGIFAQRFLDFARFQRDVAEPKTARVFFVLGDGDANIRRRFFAESIERGGLPVLANLLQLGEICDAEIFVKRLDFFRADAAQLEQLKKPRRKFRFELFKKIHFSRVDQLGDFFRDGFADAADFREPVFARHRRDVAGKSLDRASGVCVSADFENHLAFEFE